MPVALVAPLSLEFRAIVARLGGADVAGPGAVGSSQLAWLDKHVRRFICQKGGVDDDDGPADVPLVGEAASEGFKGLVRHHVITCIGVCLEKTRLLEARRRRVTGHELVATSR